MAESPKNEGIAGGAAAGDRDFHARVESLSAGRKLFAAIDADDLAGDVCAAGAAEENGEARDVLRRSDMFQAT